uniref:Inosine/uridine-preferring nucleoside hydrolase domain-containing protein n=1 Tax=Calcidiscus leptoporus TaxID=127549 RepID=A0A7S0JDY1_9EUKA|mmetsp:Transcript_53396/g.122709  ORF Transcript_53396/g.122709 Transcript_53396/m.122709 type:complete len:338 (+) Transcript_53396:46-1059(+)
MHALMTATAATAATAAIESSTATLLCAERARVRAVVVDTDVGMDDVAAIALLAAAKIPVELITTTCGICQPGTGSVHMQHVARALGLTCRVVAGAEDARVETHAQWEHSQHEAISALCGSFGTAAPVPRTEPSGEAAADAILEAARAETQRPLTVLALGGMTNLGIAARKDPRGFARIERIVFVGGVRTTKAGYHHQPYNARLDPHALRDVLRSRVPLLLLGHECFPTPAWCTSALATLKAAARSLATAEVPWAARILSHVFELDERQMAFDPLAVFYLAHPEAFAATEPMAVRVTEGAQWRFEQSAAEGADAEGVVEFGGIDLDSYRDWLVRATTL